MWKRAPRIKTPNMATEDIKVKNKGSTLRFRGTEGVEWDTLMKKILTTAQDCNRRFRNYLPSSVLIDVETENESRVMFPVALSTPIPFTTGWSDSVLEGAREVKRSTFDFVV
jgi:hypothetical protein